MEPASRRKLLEAIEASRLKLTETGSFRDADVAADVIAENLDLWKQTKDRAALDYLTSLVHGSTKRIVRRTDPSQLPLPGFKTIGPLVNMAGLWIAPGKASQELIARHLKWLEARRGGTERRSRQDDAEVKEYRRLLRMVTVYGKGDPNFTAEQAIEARQKRLLRQKRAAIRSRWEIK